MFNFDPLFKQLQGNGWVGKEGERKSKWDIGEGRRQWFGKDKGDESKDVSAAVVRGADADVCLCAAERGGKCTQTATQWILAA